IVHAHLDCFFDTSLQPHDVHRFPTRRSSDLLDAEAVAVAGMIIERKTGSFDPSSFRDRYQEALKESIEAKLKGLPVKARPAARQIGRAHVCSSHVKISYAVFCLKKKIQIHTT